jgi:V/A-type H+-transporting ATPase subunit C
MKKQPPLNYIFGVAKIRALERLLIKQEVFEEAVESGLGDALKLFAESENYSDELLSVKDSAALEKILAIEALKLKGLMRDLILDSELLGLLEVDAAGRLKDILLKYPSEFLEDYFMHVIDLHNIKSFLRLYLLKEPQGKLDRALVCEGFIKKKDFLQLYGQDLALFLHKLEYVHKRQKIIDYSYYLCAGIQKAAQEKSFASLEKAINDFLAEALKPAKYLNFGPEPILAYYFAKANEINLIRIVILAKLNNVSTDLIKQRLNYAYA